MTYEKGVRVFSWERNAVSDVMTKAVPDEGAWPEKTTGDPNLEVSLLHRKEFFVTTWTGSARCSTHRETGWPSRRRLSIINLHLNVPSSRNSVRVSVLNCSQKTSRRLMTFIVVVVNNTFFRHIALFLSFISTFSVVLVSMVFVPTRVWMTVWLKGEPVWGAICSQEHLHWKGLQILFHNCQLHIYSLKTLMSANVSKVNSGKKSGKQRNSAKKI